MRRRHGLQQDPAAMAELSAARPAGGRYRGGGCGRVRIPLLQPGLGTARSAAASPGSRRAGERRREVDRRLPDLQVGEPLSW